MKFLHRCFALLAFVLAALLLTAPLVLGATLVRLALLLPIPLNAHGVAGYMMIDLPPFANVAASGLATAKFDNIIGYTIDRIILELGGGNTKANMTLIRMLANEKEIFNDTGSNCDSRMQYRGITANASYLTLDFSEIRARTIVGQRVGSIDTISAGINKISCEVTLGAGVAPTLSSFAMLSAAPQTDPAFNRLIAKIANRTFNPGGSGEFLFDFNYQRVPFSYIKRVHLIGATVTAARAKKNGIEILKATNARKNFVQTEFLRTPQANIYCFDFVVDGNMSDALPMANAQSMEWYVTTSGAGNITMIVELLDLLENN